VVRYGKPFTWPQHAARPAAEPAADALKHGKLFQSGLSLLTKAGKKAGEYFLQKVFGARNERMRPERLAGDAIDPDMTYNLEITRSQAQFGDVLQINLPHFEKEKLISVRIPRGVKTGTRLRLKDMGNLLPGSQLRRGDVYLVLKVA
jgi:DnaJ-class molecular chaperone